MFDTSKLLSEQSFPGFGSHKTSSRQTDFIRSTTKNLGKSLEQQFGMLSNMTSATGKEKRQIIDNLSAEQRAQIENYNKKFKALLDEIAALPDDERVELERSQNNNLESIVRSLIVSLDDLENTELLARKLDQVRGFIARVKPKVLANASKKSHVLTELKKLKLKVDFLQQRTKKFREDLNQSKLFNDQVFQTVMHFEQEIAQPFLHLSFMGSVISSYYVFTTPPNFLELQNSVSNMFLVYSQLVILGNFSLLHYMPQFTLDHNIMWDPSQLVNFNAQLRAQIGMNYNIATNIMSDAGFAFNSARATRAEMRHVFNMPIVVDFVHPQVNYMQYATHLDNQTANVAFMLDNLMTQFPQVRWSDIVKIASYADPDTIQRMSVLFKVPTDRVVGGLVRAAKDFTQEANKMLMELRTAYKRYTPDILKKQHQFNAFYGEDSPDRRLLSDGMLVNFVNFELLRASPQRYERTLSFGSRTVLKLADMDARVSRQEIVRNIRMAYGLLWQTVALLDFVPLLFDFFMPLKNMSRGGHFTSLYTQVAKLAGLRNSIIKAFWVGANRNGVEGVIKASMRWAALVESLYNAVVAFVAEIRSLRDTFIFRNTETSLQPLKGWCQKIMLLLLTGQENGDATRVMKELNPSLKDEDANIEELEEALNVENTSDFNLNIV